VATATGWSVKHILWGISWVNLQMMIADAPRYVTGNKMRRGKALETAEDFAEMII
jgi:hypothetical protein